MANVIDTITKYSTEALDTVLATESKTAVLELSKKWLNLNFNKAGKVEILDIVMDGLSNYYRANSATADSGRSNYNASGVHGDGYKVGNTQAHWQIYSLAYDRGKQFQIDEMDDEETAGLMIANVLKEFLRTQVVPEVDAVRFARIAGAAYTSMGNKVVETPNATKAMTMKSSIASTVASNGSKTTKSLKKTKSSSFHQQSKPLQRTPRKSKNTSPFLTTRPKETFHSSSVPMRTSL